MLTGFDSKLVNTLYLDKILQYENLIQAFSRTNRLYNFQEKPFGIIKYYRRPNTMERNIVEAVEAYSGNIPTGLFVDKLPNNIRNINHTFGQIELLFKNEGIDNFEKLPDGNAAKAKFAKLFKELSSYLDAALIQGFTWDKSTYLNENGDELVVLFNHEDYLKLLARYKELSRGRGETSFEDAPFDIDIRITEQDSEKIDSDYMNGRFNKYLKLLTDGSSDEILENILKELHSSFSMLSQEEQKYANIFLHDIQSGNAKLDANKPFKEYILDMLKKVENNKIERLIKILDCSEPLLRELYDKGVTEENILEHGVFDELKASVNTVNAMEFFKSSYKDNFIKKRLSMYIDEYLRYFLLNNGEDQFQKLEYLTLGEVKYESKKVKQIDIVLTDTELKNTKTVSAVSFSQLLSWYNESKAVLSIVSSDTFAYIENKLCLNTKDYIERNQNGGLELTAYAKDHEEECFLRFIVDTDTGKLRYVVLPSALASKTFNYYDEINEDLLENYGLVNEMSNEMLKEINNMGFGDALIKLMSKNICNYSFRLLEDTTGLDKGTISNMCKGISLTKLNVVSACLGIHIPSRVSKKMLKLAEITLDTDLTGNKGIENNTYDMLIHFKWATDYDDIYDELNKQNLGYLIKNPK